MPYATLSPAVFLYVIFTYSCQDGNQKTIVSQPQLTVDTSIFLSYKKTKQSILTNREKYAAKYLEVAENERYRVEEAITDFWIWSISNDLFRHWEGTPWDFNGTTLTPKEGTIACGFLSQQSYRIWHWMSVVQSCQFVQRRK